MTSRHLIQLVAARELRDRLGNRAFLITTAISLLVIVGIIVAPSFLDDGGPTTASVGVLADADVPPDFPDALVATGATLSYDEVTVESVADRATAETAVDDGDLDAVVIDEDTLLLASPSTSLEQLVAQSLQAASITSFLADAQVDPAALQAASALPDLDVVLPDGTDSEALDEQFGIGFIITVLLFLTLQINGASVLTTTVEEKSSRVVEVLLGTLRPWQLLSGKLVAMTALSIGQLLLYAGAALVAILLTGDVDLPAAAGSVLVASIAMFVVGFGLYASIYAVAGALATSAEEAQSSAAPIGFISAAVYMAVLIGVVPNPDGLLARVLTFIPFSAPFAIPVRMTAGMPWWEVVVGFSATLLGLVVIVRLAGRLYSAAILSGGKLSWRAALRAEPIT
jgi:ABC-2 type transport system permease protein